MIWSLPYNVFVLCESRAPYYATVHESWDEVYVFFENTRRFNHSQMSLLVLHLKFKDSARQPLTIEYHFVKL